MTETHGDRCAAAMQEDRSAMRVRAAVPVTLRFVGGEPFDTLLRDISLSGFSAIVVDRVTPRTKCSLSLGGKEIAATVAWWDNGLVGCGFDNLLNSQELSDALVPYRVEGTVKTAATLSGWPTIIAVEDEAWEAAEPDPQQEQL